MLKRPGFIASVFACCLAALVALPSSIRAQTTGSIAGWVADSSGARLPGVTIEATSTRLQGIRVAVTGSDGTYRLPALPPGLYTFRASLPGFAGIEKTGTVTLDATSTVNMILRLSLKEEVLVSAGSSLIDTTSTTTGTSYSSNVIEHLPVDRNYADIVRANPGVFTDHGATQGRSLALSVYGATSAENQWIIDGVDTTNVEKGIQGKAINSEFLEEVEVKTGGYQAEYGRALGGVVNVITKSGGNVFHGAGFLYYDATSMRAKRVFTAQDSKASGMRLADYQRTDFGLDLGGYLIKDRLWFFAAYDRVEFPGRVSTVDNSNPLVPSSMTFPVRGTDNLYSGKVTWNIASSSALVATVFADPTRNSGAGDADPRQGVANVGLITNPEPGTWKASRLIGGTDFGLRFQRLLGSRGLATLQASRHRDDYWLKPWSHEVRLSDWTCEGGSPESPCGWPAFERLDTGGFGFVYGPADQTDSRSDQYRAEWNLYLGAHDLKLGSDFQNSRTTSGASFTGGQQVTRFNEYGQVYYEHDFFVRSKDDLTPVNVSATTSGREVAFYVQDSWRLTPRWTVNAGVRLDQEDLRDGSDRSVLKTTNEWQPRLGVVGDLTGDGTTKAYAFAGRFYYSVSSALTLRPFLPWIYAVTFNFDPVDRAPSDDVLNHESYFFGTGVVPSGYSGLASESVDAGLKGVYQDEYTLGVEKLFGSSLWISLKGTYRRLGNAIEDRCDLDYSRPENNYSNCGIMNPGSNGRIARGEVPGCNGLDDDAFECSSTVPPTPPARRLYRGIELVARRSFTNRLWVQASYVYSSLRGNYDGAVNQSCPTCWQEPGIMGDFDFPSLLHNGYGRLYLDRPHDVRLSGFLATPFKLSVGLQGYLASGPPLDRLGYFNGAYGSGVQLVKRGYAGRLPTQWDASLTLEYPVTLGPITTTVQAYVYNVFNNQIPTAQDSRWSIQAPDDYPASIHDPNQRQGNSEYGKVTGRTDPRLFRAAIRVSF